MDFSAIDTYFPGMDICVNGTASASSELYGAYLASRAFDGTTNYWHSTDPATLPEWIKYDLGEGVTRTAAKYTICPYNGNYGCPTEWKFQGSNDDLNWDDLDTQTEQTLIPEQKNVYDSFVNITAYRYYRWLLSAIYDVASFVIIELEIMEAP